MILENARSDVVRELESMFNIKFSSVDEILGIKIHFEDVGNDLVVKWSQEEYCQKIVDDF